MQITLLPGYPDLMGRRQAFVGTGSGPTSYAATAGPPMTGGDTLIVPGYERYIDCVLEIPLDPTGTYYGIAQASFAGPRATWKIFYFNAATGALITSGNLSTYNFTVSGFFGEY